MESLDLMPVKDRPSSCDILYLFCKQHFGNVNNFFNLLLENKGKHEISKWMVLYDTKQFYPVGCYIFLQGFKYYSQHGSTLVWFSILITNRISF